MKKLFLSIIIFALGIIPAFASAAELYINLDKSQVDEQGTFTGTVYVSSGGTAINNAESTISFPADLLSVDSIATAGSIFNIWVEQPTFSNSAGTIYFNGGLPTPGYTGQAGNVVRVNFRAKKAGTANISFGSSAVRANDGSGTDVLSQTRSSTILVTAGAPIVPVVPVVPIVPITPTEGVPKTPVITSVDFPDTEAWYNKTEGVFAWDLGVDVNAVQLILSRSAETVPSIMYDPPIGNKKLTEMAEGVLYLNARFRNTLGWSRIASRKIQIDTIKPENISARASVTENDLISVDATGEDSGSGIGEFVVFAKNKEIGRAQAKSNSAKFALAPLAAGAHDLTLRAYDKAKNFIETNFEAVAPEIKAPKITHYPSSIRTGSEIEISGKAAYEDGQIIVWVEEDGEDATSHTVSIDSDQEFSFTSGSITTAGTVSVWAETLRTPDVKSAPSEKIRITVNESGTVLLGTRAIQIISIAITIVVLLLVLFGFMYYGVHQLRLIKRRLRRDLVHTEQEVHTVFKMLKEDTRRHLKMLEKASTKRKLTREESKIFSELSENLDETEEYLAKKIKNIKDEDL